LNKKVIIVDSGRQFVKTICNDRRRLFQAVVANAPNGFNLNVNSSPDDLWVRFRGDSYLIGKMALRQSSHGIQERDSNKVNLVNQILTLTACSLFVNLNDEIVLVTNCPVRDWSNQKKHLEEMFIGKHLITHQAGRLKGQSIELNIGDCHVLPEGSAAYYGFSFSTNLVPDPVLINANTLVLDIGDETINYISMNPGGDPYDELSGSLDLGLSRVYAELQNWLEKNYRLEITQSSLANQIINRKALFNGKVPIFYNSELNKRYAQLANDIYHQLSSRLKFNKYQFVLLAGGGGLCLSENFRQKFNGLCEVICPPDPQWLNALGLKILYHLSSLSKAC
jgi:hypothetical protein